MLLKYIHIILFVFVISVSVFSQKISFEFNEKDSSIIGIEKIAFYSELNSKISEFDISENNPYKNLPLRFLVGNGDFKTYMVGDLYDFETYFESINQSFNKNVTLVQTAIDTFGQNRNYAAILYRVIMFDHEEVFVYQNSLSSIYVFNKFGEIQQELLHIQTDAFHPIVSTNGKYLLYKNGVNNDYYNNQLKGVNIYDLEKKENVFKIYFDYVSNFNLQNDFVWFEAGNTDSGISLYFLNTKFALLYIKEYWNSSEEKFQFMENGNIWIIKSNGVQGEIQFPDFFNRVERL